MDFTKEEEKTNKHQNPRTENDYKNGQNKKKK